MVDYSKLRIVDNPLENTLLKYNIKKYEFKFARCKLR